MLGVFKVFGSFSSSSNKSRNSKAVLLINIAGLCLVAVLSGLPGQTFYYYIGLPLVLLAQAIFLSSRVYLWQQVLFVILVATGIAFRAVV
jgi:hypothetical protein